MNEKLIFDDGRKIKFKIKIDKFPLLLFRKLESMASLSGRTIEDLVTYMLDNEVKSVEKILGSQNV